MARLVDGQHRGRSDQGGVKFALTKVDGPGTYALYTYDALSGANILFNSKDGVPDSFAVAIV